MVTTKKKLRIYALLAVIIIALVALISSVAHQHRLQQIAFVQTAITQYQHLQSEHKILSFEDVLPVLADLNTATPHSTEANTLLDEGLTHYFMPLMDNLYQHQLSDNMNNPILLYPLLKTYLMLSGTQTIDVPYVQDITGALLPPVDKKTLNNLIARAIKKSDTIAINDSIVNAARSSFKSLTLEQQAYLILLSNHPNNVAIFKNKKFNYLEMKETSISMLYTHDEFTKTLQHYIPETVQSVLKGDAVMGDSVFTQVDARDVTRLLYNVYLTAYANAWGGVISSIHLKPVTELAEANALIANFMSSDSELESLLSIIDKNTHEKQIERLSPQIARLNAFYHQQNNFQSDLKPLSLDSEFILDRIRHADYQVLKFKGALPAPISDWMQQLSHSLWTLELTHALSALNLEWATLIKPYNDTLYGHYPFAHHAPDSDIHAVDDFFNPQSTFNQFIQNKLMLFVNGTMPFWQWKPIPDFKPTTSLLAIQEILSSSALLYVKNNLDIPYVLTPSALPAKTQQFVFSTDGTVISYRQDNKPLPVAFAWQGNPLAIVSLAFKNSAGMTQEKTYEGAWALFHCFDATYITPTQNPHVYHVRFTQNGMMADMELSSTSNPHVFMKHSLELPMLPEVLF